MDLDDLEAFLAVVDAGSVAAAAVALGLPRSTLRRRLGELEARVGAPLLVTSPAGATLTDAGEALVARGRALLAAHQALLTEVAASAEAVVPPLPVRAARAK